MDNNQSSTIIDTIASHYPDTVKLLSTPCVTDRDIHFDLVIQIGALLYKEFGVEVADKAIDVDTGLIMARNLYRYIQYLYFKKTDENTIKVEKCAARKLKDPKMNPDKDVLLATMFDTLNEREKDAYKLFNFNIMMPIVTEITNLEHVMLESCASFYDIPKGMIPAGVKYAIKRRSDHVQRNAPLSALNLTNSHAKLLHGINCPPQRQKFLLANLGPMTLAGMLLSKPKDHDKIEIKYAFRQSISHLARAEEIADCLLLQKDNWAGLMKSLADLLLITSHRNNRNCYFPLELYIQAYYSMGKGGLNGKFFSNEVEMQKVYCRFTSYTWLIRCASGQEDLLKEHLFRAMFCGGVGSLSLLSKITNHANWHSRRTFYDCVRARSTQEYISINPIKFNYVGAPTLPPYFDRYAGMMTGDLVFAGFRKRYFPPQFKNYLITGQKFLSYSSDANSLISDLDGIRREYYRQHKEDEVDNGDWLKVIYEETPNFVATQDLKLNNFDFLFHY